MFYGNYSIEKSSHPRSAFTTIEETDDFSAVSSAFKPESTMVAAMDHIWESTGREAIAGSFIQLGIITHQAKTFGFTPDNAKRVLFLPGRGTGVEDRSLFDNLVENGYAVLFDNTFGYDCKAAVKDSYLISSFSSNGRTLIGKSPITPRMLELCCERMAIDSCKNFASAIAAPHHGYTNESVAAQNYPDVIEIATLGLRTWVKKADHNEIVEFDDVAEDYDFLRRAVKEASSTERGQITSEIDDLAKIWQFHLSQRHLVFEWDDNVKDYKDLIVETARDIGIESSVKAYYEGVPVEDILA